MAAQATLTGTLASRHTVASVPVTCLRHSSNGRPRKGTRKFTQEQVSSAITHQPAHKELDLPGRARDPVRISIRPVHALHVTCRPDAAPIARVPDQLFDPRLGT